jgi:hypothetical protein
MSPVLIIAALVWEVSAPTDVTTLDAIDVRVTLVNKGAAPARWNPAHPTITLIPARGQRHPAKLTDALQQSGNVEPGPGELGYSAQFDLRRLFGRLSAGSYHLRVGSSRVGFTVTATTLAAAEKANARPPGLELALDPPKVVDRNFRRYETAVFSNRTGAPVSYRAYTWGHDPKHPLQTTMSWERWHPKLGWQSPGNLGWCGTGLGKQITANRGADWVHVMHGSFSDGIYRYVLEVDQGGNTIKVPSRAVLIDNSAYYGIP